MFIVLNNDQQTQPEMFPEWCNLSSFHHYRNINKDVEPHYHDAADEVWVWEKGTAEGTVGGQSVELQPGTVVYTPVGCVHGYQKITVHSNTGIQPRLRPGFLNNNHRRITTSPPPPPSAMPPFLASEPENTPEKPAYLPERAFLRHVLSNRYKPGQTIAETNREVWWAVLVREGGIVGNVEGQAVELKENDLLIVSKSAPVTLKADTEVDLVLAIGK